MSEEWIISILVDLFLFPLFLHFGDNIVDAIIYVMFFTLLVFVSFTT